jgi:transposase-like protein
MAGKSTFTDLAAEIPDEATAWAYLERLRWPSGVPVCPHCGFKGANYIRPLNGTTRRTRTGAQSARRLWQCQACRKQFSAMTGTIFHGSKVPLRTWLFVLFEMCANKNGFAAREIERKYGVAPKTAWFMAHRLREAMKTKGPEHLLAGTIVSDETWIGGDPANRHGGAIGTKPKRNRQPVPVIPGQLHKKKTDKTPVVSLINADTGEVRSRVVRDVTGATLGKLMADNVDMERSVLYTDESTIYDHLGREFIEHNAVNHSEGEYVRGNITTNRAEGYFGQLKRSLDGTHHKISKTHLQRYLTEFDFRYSTCNMTDAQRMAKLVDGAEGRRLSYKRIKGARTVDLGHGTSRRLPRI